VSPDIWTEIAYHVQGPEGYELMKTLDVHHLKAFLPVKDFVEAKPHAKLLLNCNVGPARMPYGLCEWRATKEKKTDGCITFAYTGSHVDIYYGLDGREDDYSLSPVRSNGTRSTTAQWEQIRQGINDYRYALALDKLVADPAKGAAAKALLDKAFELGDTKRADADTEAVLKQVDAWRADAQKLLAR
jgi:hypothetical protein